NVARFSATKSPRYPARFLKSPDRKSSITVRCASGNFSCNASVRFDPIKPAPPVITNLGDECNFGKMNLGERQISLEPGSASNELKYARMQFEMRYTYDFVKRFLPANGVRILEVGCGTGELASRLLKDGYAVVAIDSDRDSIAVAQRLGVDARIATWPDFD